MDPLLRHDRTVRLIAGGLEGLALASERARGDVARFDRQVAAAAAATRHAVELGIVGAEEAEAIWASAVRRHPRSCLAGRGPSLAA
ncbi:MAG TPA: hypothetical protein VK915_11580 [Gaiellaceae bacterium]|nr:hypothetical protein [Gaiellaceae bacterium]